MVDRLLNLYDKMLTEKMTQQRIINKTLDLLLEFAEKTAPNKENALRLVKYAMEDYESEGCIILKEYRDRYSALNKLRHQLKKFDYITENGSD